MFDDSSARRREREEKHFWAIRLRGLTLLGVTFVYAYLSLTGRVSLNLLAVALILGLFAFNAARYRRVSRSFSRWMIGIDVCLITLAVWATGGVGSFLVPLYCLQVVATSLHTNTRQGVVTALNAWTLFAGMALLQANGLLPPGPLAASPRLARLAMDAGFVEAGILGFFVLLGAVTYSSAYIAQHLRVRENELAGAHQELEILYRASERFLRARTPEDLARELCRGAHQLGAREVAVFLEPGEASAPPLCLCRHPSSMGRPTFAPLEERAAAYFRSRPGDREHLRLDEEEEYGVVRFRLGDGTRGATVVRVAIEELMGASPEGMTLLVQQFAPALSNLRHLEVQATLATTDPLTGACNRREFDRFLGEEVARARRYLRPLSLVLVDVDHFKRLNDTRGHQDGDRVLQGVVRAMRRVVRSQDMLARYGGEEFTVVAPETGPRQAEILGERLRRAIEDEGYWEADDPGPRVTASLGVASRLPTPDGPDYEELLRRADLALYAAKEGGRNQVKSYGPEVEPEGEARDEADCAASS